ncbi:MAG: hypothetical protein Q9192_006353 [Flavoplaca navasiana]
MNTLPDTSGRSPPTAPGPYMGFSDEVVTILVGPEKAPFRIHKGLLCSKSEYFRAAFKGSSKESTENNIHLTDDSPEIFQFYAALIYTEKPAASWDQEQLSMDVCCRLYVLADKLGSEDIQNVVMDLIHKRCADDYFDITDADTVNYVFDNTLPGSCLRAILTGATFELDIETCPELVNTAPEFLYEVLKIFSNRLKRKLMDEEKPLDMDRCKTYHVHANGRSCSPTTS